MKTLDGNDKNVLSNFSIQQITQVKEALAQGGYINVAAQDILSILQKVQAQTNAIIKQKHQRRLLKDEAINDNSNSNTNKRNNIRRKSKLQSKYDNNTEKDILALGRQYYYDSTHNNNLHQSNESRYGSGNSSISINSNGRRQQQHQEQQQQQQQLLCKENKLHGKQVYRGQKQHSHFSQPHKLSSSSQQQQHHYYHYNHDHRGGRPRSAAPSWNSSTHVSRLAIRGPHFPLANQRVRLTPNDLLHSATHSQFSDTYSGDPLSHRARLERQLRKYYHNNHQHHRQHNILQQKQEHQSASNFKNNFHVSSENNVNNTNSRMADNNVVLDNSMHTRNNNNQDNVITNHYQRGVDVSTSRRRKKKHTNVNTSTASTNTNINHTNAELNMTPADRRAANLIFAITGDSRYRFRPATSNLNSFSCDNGHHQPNCYLHSNTNNINNNYRCQRVYSHMYNASATDRHKGKALSNFSVNYLNADGSTLCERADPVQRGAQMRELWRRDRFLRKHN